MNNILQDLSSARVAQALDANKIAFGALLSTLPQAALYAEPGLRWFETGVPEEVIRHWFTVYSGLPLGPERSLRLYLGSIAGKPVATVELFLEAGVAAINHVVTVHQFRQQGIGAMMTLMAAREARQAGYRIG